VNSSFQYQLFSAGSRANFAGFAGFGDSATSSATAEFGRAGGSAENCAKSLDTVAALM
jgi:hypothetical protein